MQISRLKALKNLLNFWVEDRIIQEKVDQNLGNEATFIACKDEVDDSILQALAEAGCIVMADLEGPGLQDIADTCNAWVIDHLNDIDQAHLGILSP